MISSSHKKEYWVYEEIQNNMKNNNEKKIINEKETIPI